MQYTVHVSWQNKIDWLQVQFPVLTLSLSGNTYNRWPRRTTEEAKDSRWQLVIYITDDISLRGNKQASYQFSAYNVQPNILSPVKCTPKVFTSLYGAIIISGRGVTPVNAMHYSIDLADNLVCNCAKYIKLRIENNGNWCHVNPWIMTAC